MATAYGQKLIECSTRRYFIDLNVEVTEQPQEYRNVLASNSITTASTECLWLRGGLPGEGFKGGGRIGPFFQRLTRMDPLGGICYSPRRTRAGNQPPSNLTWSPRRERGTAGQRREPVKD
jgi:hypothetical protein